MKAQYWLIWMLLAFLGTTSLSFAQKKERKAKKNASTSMIEEIQTQPIPLQTTSYPTIIPLNGHLCEEERIESIKEKKQKELQLKIEKETIAKNKAYCAPSMIPVGNCIFLDEKYLTTEEYFAIWDTENVNPYSYSIQSFKDSVHFTLFCDEKGKHWSYPVKSRGINSQYGVRRFRFHHGIDLDLVVGEPIYAVFDGVVRIAKYNKRGYGNYVLIRHDNGLETIYGHLKSYNVKPGDVVKAGQMIGLGGNTGRSTGPHLHFEVRYRGHAFNPTYIFDFEKEQILAQQFVLTPSHYEKIIEEHKTVYHRVRNGDSLWTLSRRYRTSITALCKMNGISSKTVLRIGSLVRVR
ncbi:MAG: hypothetical protein OHK0038_02330 [Flammeovirgaceae bacterium]